MVIGSSGRLVVFGFVAVVASFVAASVFQEYSSGAIDGASADLETDAMPSIEHLAAVGGEIRAIEYLLDRWIDERTGGKASDRAGLEAALHGLGEEQRAYLKLPKFEGEDVLADSMEQADVDFLRSVEKAMNQYDLGARELAQQTVDSQVTNAAERLFRVSGQAIDFNARQSADLAAIIERTRQRDVVYRWLLDTLCALFSALTAFALWRSLKRSERVREENARLLERRAQELETFAGRVAHDILSPLSAVRLSLSMIARGAESRERELIARGQRALSRVEQLTDGLLQFARAGAAPSPDDATEVGPVVDGVLEEMRPSATASGIELAADAPPRVDVACTAGILTSLLSNLLRNAVKYMGDAPRRKISVRVLERPTRVRFEVEDTGPGIDPDLIERIFQPYVRGATSGQPGLGLGLATVKRLAESHGGATGVSTRPGTGSTFWFELPRAAPVSPHEHPGERPSLH